MNFYNKYVLPKITNYLCSGSSTMKQRQKVIPFANGRVLEIGIGSGLNFSFYNSDKVDHLIALEPAQEMINLAKKQQEHIPFPIAFLKAFAEEIPIDSNSIDTVVITYTLCSIPNTISSLNEIKRVLKSKGSFIFCEHGLAKDKSVRKWQKLINPAWKMLGGGCDLTKDIPNLIKNAGFDIQKLDQMYIPGFKPASYNYWGLAKPN